MPRERVAAGRQLSGASSEAAEDAGLWGGLPHSAPSTPSVLARLSASAGAAPRATAQPPLQLALPLGCARTAASRASCAELDERLAPRVKKLECACGDGDAAVTLPDAAAAQARGASASGTGCAGHELGARASPSRSTHAACRRQ